MGENLFEGLPPPSSSSCDSQTSKTTSFIDQNNKNYCKNDKNESTPLPAPNPLPPALKSALKRSKPPESQPQDCKPERKLRFKTSTDASETQVIEAMQKIASHIKNPSKFGKASKLAIQLIQSGSVKPETSDHFVAILEAAMSSSITCTDASVRADYHTLFTAAQDASECFNKKQKNQLTTWTIRAVMANDLLTDDSFVFSKTAIRLKEVISKLPVATETDDMDEAAALKDEKEVTNAIKQGLEIEPSSREYKKVEFDPFGLDALIPSTSKKDEKAKTKKDAATKIKEEEEETKRFLKSQREALIICLEIAARRYNVPWCQTVIDILVKHASDNITRFTSQQRDAIKKLWNSVNEQHNRRKQGKSVSGKLDVNGFEWLQQKYANEKISIRNAVGGSGERKAQQWLG